MAVISNWNVVFICMKGSACPDWLGVVEACPACLMRPVTQIRRRRRCEGNARHQPECLGNVRVKYTGVYYLGSVV